MSKHVGTEGRLQHLSQPPESSCRSESVLWILCFPHAAKPWLMILDFLVQVAGDMIQYDHGWPSFCAGLPPNSASLPVRWSWNRRPVSRILLCGGSGKHSPVIGGMAVWLCHWTIHDWYCMVLLSDTMHLREPPSKPPSSSSINEPVSGMRRRASRRAGDLGWRRDKDCWKAKCSAATSWGTTSSEIPRPEKSKRSYCQSWKKPFKWIW